VARLGHPGKGGGRVKTVVAYIDGRKRLDGVITLDNTTLGEYVAEDSSSDRIDAVIAALSGTVSVKVYDGSGVEKASGTMGSPWATNVSGQLVVGALSSFSVTGAGTPDAGWYLRFESGARWVRGSFGLKGSGQEFTWSQSTWAVGHTGRIGNVVMLAPTNAAPGWSGAPSTLSLYAGQTYNFAQHASDPNSDPLTFTLAAGSGDQYELTTAGVLTIGTVSKSVTIRASDGVLTADHVCGVTVQTAPVAGDSWPIQQVSYLPAVRNRALFAQDNRHAFGVAETDPTIYRVNTTNPTASLSLQGDGTYRGGFVPAMQASGPRIIVFETSGTIDLGGNFYETQSNSNGSTKDHLWIAGQTAPSPGVTFTNGGLRLNSSHMLVQHLRIQNTRLSSDGAQSYSMGVGGSSDNSQKRSNVVFDHCDFYFGSYDTPVGGNLLIYGIVGPLDVIESSLVWPIRTATSIGGSTLLYYNNESGRKISFQGCFLAHHRDRSPLSDAPAFLLANNIIFDHGRTRLRERAGIPTLVNIVGNIYLRYSQGTGADWLQLMAAGDENGFGWTSKTNSAYNGSTKLWLDGNRVHGSVIANQTSTSAFPNGVQNSSGLPASSLKASSIISSAVPSGWQRWPDLDAMESHILAKVGARPSNRTGAATQALSDYQSNITRILGAPNYVDSGLAVNTSTFNLNAYGSPFSPRTGETSRTNIEAYLLDLGEAA
jgi:hypothetical protein